ncbi:MAG: DEAD/DEAH box helicase family protein [Clostridium sp.]|uniref:DEAD/DEAH box helicase family protein n=1 Tax=Clostridium sp. TaxID=1506 RepID=UPI003EE542AD
MSTVITMRVLRRCVECVSTTSIGYKVMEQFCRRALFKPAYSPPPQDNRYAEPPDPNDGDFFYIPNERLSTILIHPSMATKLKEELGLNRILVTMYEDRAKIIPGKKVKFRPNFRMVEPEDSKYAWQNAAAPLIVSGDHNVFELQTGKGKTIAAEKGVALRQRLPMFITKPAYLAKWKSDIAGDLNLTEGEDFFLIDSVDTLEDLVRKGGKPTAKAYLCSSFTIDRFIQKWMHEVDSIHPNKILPSLGVDITVYDEAHELFRMQYWSYIALNANAVLDLSGTLKPDDPFLKKRYLERFPENVRLEMELDIFIDVVGLAFGMSDRKVVRRVNSQRMYAHHVFEKGIMKRKQMMYRYFDMLYRILDKWYIAEFQPGQKALYLFYTREMCTLFATYLRNKTQGLRIYRYIQDDDFAETENADVIVSTHGKSGTAVDYKGLILNVIAVSLNASQKSLQMLGRTRDGCIERWGIHPKVVYPICMDIPKQVSVYNQRRKLLTGRVRSLITMNSGVVI